EKVQEVKVETIVEASKLTAATKSMIRAHPYEEVAYDIYPLQNKGPTYGIGRIGKMKENMTLQALCERVKKAYDVPAVRVSGDRSEEHTSELQSRFDLVCRLLLEKKNKIGKK